MPNKAVPGFTQVPVVAANLRSLFYERLNDTGTQCNLSVVYEVKDDAGVVRAIREDRRQVGAYPVAVNTIVSTINSVEGT